MWALRERIAEGVMHEGYTYKYDVSLPLKNFYKVIEVLRQHIKSPEVLRISGYGHLGKVHFFFYLYIFLFFRYSKKKI